MNPVQRLYRADDRRKTRFHDQKGNRLDAAGLLYTPRVFLETVLRAVFGYRPVQPWISYRAASTIASLLRHDSRVLEFGSGMSTVWFAERVASVVSIESDPVWFDRIQAVLAKRSLSNVDLRLRSLDDYANLDGMLDRSIDFVLVDGPLRLASVVAAVPKLRDGGSIYLDNTDDPAEHGAEQFLARAVAERGGHTRYFIDYVPGKITATEGLLARL